MLDTETHHAREHNRPAAVMWGTGGAHYDRVSFAISDAIGHATQRLAAKPGEQVLDLATGTGWGARNLARTGATVTAVDLAPDFIAAARGLAAHIDPPIDFRVADAEDLPFADGSFDRVVSTFGVMFAGDHRRAASELTRVVRPGGRLVLATWLPDSSVARMFGIVGRHNPAPPAPQSPLLWGDVDYLADLFGDAFDLMFESGVSHAYEEGPQDIWDAMHEGFGPIRTVYAALEGEQKRAFKAEIDAYHAEYMAAAGLHITREYLITVGTKV